MAWCFSYVQGQLEHSCSPYPAPAAVYVSAAFSLIDLVQRHLTTLSVSITMQTSWRNANWQGKPTYSDKYHPSATLFTTNPIWPDLGWKLGRRGGKPELVVMLNTTPNGSIGNRIPDRSDYSLEVAKCFVVVPSMSHAKARASSRPLTAT
jgi:hypothetical protein